MYSNLYLSTYQHVHSTHFISRLHAEAKTTGQKFCLKVKRIICMQTVPEMHAYILTKVSNPTLVDRHAVIVIGVVGEVRIHVEYILYLFVEASSCTCPDHAVVVE